MDVRKMSTLSFSGKILGGLSLVKLLVLVDKIWQPQMLNFSLMLAALHLSHSGFH